MSNKVLLIDGNNLLFRVFHIAKIIPEKNDKTFYVYLFLNSLKSYIELFDPFKIIVCWDNRENQDGKNARKLLDENYKAQRDKDEAKEVYECTPIITKLLDTLGVTQINPLNLEADDIIFYLSTVKYPNQSVIISTDTDMYQLISEDLPYNIIYNPKKKREITQLFLKEQYNVTNGFEFIIQKALRGDKADNLVGVKGIRSTKIQDIINIISNNYDLESLKSSGLLKDEELDIFKHNLMLMKFNLDFISKEEIEWYEECINRPKNISKEEFTILIMDLEFWNIYKKIDHWFRTFNRIDFSDIFSALFAQEN